MEELPHSIAAVKAGDPSPGVRHVALGVQHAYLGLQHFYSTYQLLSKGKSNKSLERISFTGLWWPCQAEKSEDVLCSVTCPPKTFSMKTSACPQKSNTASVSLHSSLLGICVQ